MASSRASFIGVDGEGYTIEETGDHIYYMMASSLGNSVYDEAGLSTYSCFRFLLDTKRFAGKNSILVGFAFNYDINNMLRDVAKSHLVELFKTGRTRWRHYRLQWTPNKYFTISDWRKRESVRVYDTFGFFQTSFVKALEGWRIDAPPMIEHMKRRRSDFTPEMAERVLEYCVAECVSLVDLMNALRDSIRSVNLPVSQWHGAGAIAAALLAREGVHNHVQRDSVYGDLQPSILAAYYGGRSEVFKMGEFPELWGYDIRSAYPAACVELPSMVGASFVKGTPAPGEIALQYVRWRCDPNSYIMPFPFRHKRVIYYPAEGEGWYWSVEVEAAKAIHGNRIEIIDSFRLEAPNGHIKPLSFVRPIYEERARLKREGHFGHQSYKLAINALYGKLAQGTSFDKRRDPRFRTYVWAGWITATCRARMLSLATPDVVAIATDGIYFDRDPDYECGDGLGELEKGSMRDAFIAQPGIYAGTNSKGEVIKSRGVYPKEIDFRDLREGYRKYGPYYESVRPSTRFVGLGTVLTLRNFSDWRKWREGERRINLHPTRKFVVDPDARPIVHTPPLRVAEGPSEAYTPKTSGIDAPGMVDFIQALEQPTRV